MDADLPGKLAQLPLFAQLDNDALAAVAQHVYEVEARAGQVLIEIGQPGAGMFVLEEGELEVQLPTGETVTLSKPGEFVGDLALLTDEPHVARVRAHTEVRCLAISAAGLHRAPGGAATDRLGHAPRAGASSRELAVVPLNRAGEPCFRRERWPGGLAGVVRRRGSSSGPAAQPRRA